jgi:hypothetical protein
MCHVELGINVINKLWIKVDFLHQTAFGKCKRRGGGGRCKVNISINNQLMPVDSMIERYSQAVILSLPQFNTDLRQIVVKKEQEW